VTTQLQLINILYHN